MSYNVLSAVLLLVLPLTFARGCSARAKLDSAIGAAAVPAHDTLTRPLPDGIRLTADVYRQRATGDEAMVGDKPVLVCMHMTSSSRGEYKRLAAELLALGVHVMSVDLRSGGPGEIADRKTGERSGTMNETWRQARALLGRDPTYIEAYPDVVAAVAWAKELFPYSRIGLVGSSYSASLALVYAAEHPSAVDVVAALSPGEYMQPWSIATRVKDLAVPTYFTCGNTQADMGQARPVAAAILDQTKVRTFWPEDEGIIGDHGSRTLMIHGAVNHQRQWEKFRQGIAPVMRPLSAEELQRRREALAAPKKP
ncbi:MAG: alpha/beta fold hydrolase [Planctomycetes bacterium]|nr:alpha/beta fold hydrolase [Planctomycetota bacterium]